MTLLLLAVGVLVLGVVGLIVGLGSSQLGPDGAAVDVEDRGDAGAQESAATASIFEQCEGVERAAPDLAAFATAYGPGLRCVALVHGVGGEVEGCACSERAISGGLLQTLFVLAGLRGVLPNMEIADAGNNRSAREGLMPDDEIPGALMDCMDGVFDLRAETVTGGVRIPSGDDDDRWVELHDLAIPERSEWVTLVWFPEAARSSGETSQLEDQTAAVMLAMARRRPGDESVDVPAGVAWFVRERAQVHGAAWKAIPALVELRERVLAEWIDARARPFTDDARTPNTEACRSCHETEYQGWLEHRTHAAAWESLVPYRGAKENPFCITCHTTNVSSLTLRAPQPLRIPEPHRAVQCEACHTPATVGGDTIADPEYGSACDHACVRPAVDHCRSCHTPGRDTVFANGDLRNLLGCRQD